MINKKIQAKDPFSSKNAECTPTKQRKRSGASLAPFAPRKKSKSSPMRYRPQTRILATWGWNEDKQLGLPGGIIEQHRPMRVEALDGVLACAAGGQHMAAIDKSGNLLTWGCNDLGGLGRMTKDIYSNNVESQEESEREPEIIQKGVVGTSSGGGFTLSMNKDGHVLMHGCFRSYEGKIVREKYLGNSSEAVRYDSMPVKFDGKVKVMACGENFCALIDDLGDLFTFGVTIEALGRMDLPPGISDGEAYLLDNKICQEMLEPRPVASSKGRTFISCAAGKYHLVALAKSRDGKTSVWSIGRNEQGQLGLGDTKIRPTLTRVVALNSKKIASISCGEFHTVCVDEAGSIWVFGKGSNGQLGSKAMDECSGDYKELRPVQVQIPNEHVVEVACGDNHTLLRTKSNKVYTMGCGDFGKLGHGNEKDSFVPKEIDFTKSGFEGVTVHSMNVGSGYSAIVCSVDKFSKVENPGSVYDDDEYPESEEERPAAIKLEELSDQDEERSLVGYQYDASSLVASAFVPDPQFSSFGWF